MHSVSKSSSLVTDCEKTMKNLAVQEKKHYNNASVLKNRTRKI